MWKRVVFYGALLAAGTLALQWLDYQRMARAHSGEIYWFLIATAFLALGVYIGARVIGGTLNGQGTFVMRADRVGQDTVLAQIVRMVARAQRSRAPIQRLADEVSAWFVPAVVLIAVIAAIAWARRA